MAIGMLSYTVIGLTDTLVVGRLGTAHLAGVGLAETFFYLINALFLGTLHGVKVLVSQADGSNDRMGSSQAGWHGIALAVPAGALVIWSSLVAGDLFAWTGASQAIAAHATDYFVWRVWASPFWYVMLAVSEYLQGRGDSRTPMRFNLVLAVVNVVLDVVLVFGVGPIPALGVPGAAIATLIACVVAALWALRVFLRQVPDGPRWTWAVSRSVVREGAPIGLRMALDIGAFSAFAAILARQGEVQFAAHQIAIRIVSVSFLPGHGISEAASVLYGRYVGANQPARAHASYLASLKVVFAVMGLCGLLFWAMPEALVGVFQRDPEVIAVGSTLLLYAAAFQLLDGAYMVGVGAMNGAGRSRVVMPITALSSWLIVVPLTWYLVETRQMGAAGGWLAILLQIGLVAVILTTLVMRMRGRGVRVSVTDERPAPA